jgi:hypothetical protein
VAIACKNYLFLKRCSLNSQEIYANLKELTLDLMAGKRSRAATVEELHRRIEANLVYDMDPAEPNRELISQVFVSLDNLIAEDFPPAEAEIRYFGECFNGQRQFNLNEVRELTVESKVEDEKPEKVRQPAKPRFKKPIGRPDSNHFPKKSGWINR